MGLGRAVVLVLVSGGAGRGNRSALHQTAAPCAS